MTLLTRLRGDHRDQLIRYLRAENRNLLDVVEEDERLRALMASRIRHLEKLASVGVVSDGALIAEQHAVLHSAAAVSAGTDEIARLDAEMARCRAEHEQHPLAVCEFCGKGLSHPLADCDDPRCKRMAKALADVVGRTADEYETYDELAAVKRAEDR